MKVLNKTENFGSRDHSRGSAFSGKWLGIANPRGCHVITCEGPQLQPIWTEITDPRDVKIISALIPLKFDLFTFTSRKENYLEKKIDLNRNIGTKFV